MDHQDAPIDCHPFLLAHGDRSLSLYAGELSDGTPSPGTQSWLTDTSDFSQRASSKSPSLCSVPSTCSTQDFLPTPPPNSTLRLPQVPTIPSIRHRTPQACDKCRERKTKCSGHRPTCLRCSSRALSCKYSARETRIRGSLKSRALVQAFDDGPLYSRTMERNTDLWGFPTPAHHSRMGSCQTSAFTRSPDGSNDPKAPIMPVYTSQAVPTLGRHYAWNQLEELVPPPLPSSLRCDARPRFSLDSDSVDRTRNALPISLPLLDTRPVNGPYHHQRSISINQEYDFDYPRLNRRTDADYLFPSNQAGQDLVSHSIAGRLDMAGGQSFFDFNETPFSLVDTENFSAPGFPLLSNFRTPHPAFDTHFLNGFGAFY